MSMNSEPAGRHGPTGSRLWLLRAIAASGVLLVTFTVCEVFVRVKGLAPVIHDLGIDTEWGSFESSPDPRLRYVPKAGSADINSYGIRDHEFAIEKAPGTERIVVIGDSFAFGLGIDDIDDTFSEVLEVELRERRSGGPDLEVLNLGVSGYDTEQQVEFFKLKGLALDPDLVIVSFCLNDYFDSSHEGRRFAADGRQQENHRLWAALQSNVLYRSHLVRYLAARAGRFGGAGSGSETDQGTPASAGPNRVQRGFTELRRMADERGFSVLVMIWPDLMGFENYRFARAHTDTHENAKAVGFDLIDLYMPFFEVTGNDSAAIRLSDGHPNVHGHALAARTVAAHLIGAS